MWKNRPVISFELRMLRRFNAIRFKSSSVRRQQLPPQSFPCLDRLEQRTREFKESGPEPVYSRPAGYNTYTIPGALKLDYGQEVSDVVVAYETWGDLNAEKSNVILLHTGLSASSHATSTEADSRPGWWQKFVGPGLKIDTNKFFVICCNVLGGCFGSTGPSSLTPDMHGRYATRFPIITIHDMIRAQHRLIRDHFGIEKLYANVGSSMGGMQSLAYARDFPGQVGRVASISGCARSHPSSIAQRYVQRAVLMNDPHWNRGFYYDQVPPHSGMKLARQIATITYRSGPEWESRFARDRADPSQPPALCPDFLIETYLDHQGEKFVGNYDPNSLLYISKAMDLFDLGAANLKNRQGFRESDAGSSCTAIPKTPFEERARSHVTQSTIEDLVEGMEPLRDIPTFVLGVESDTLFPYWQQREIRDVLQKLGNRNVEHHELGMEQSWFGHDTFLLDLDHVGQPLKEFLEN